MLVVCAFSGTKPNRARKRPLSMQYLFDDLLLLPGGAGSLTASMRSGIEGESVR